MSLSLSEFLKMQTFAQAESQLKQLVSKFEAHMSEDKAKIEAEFKEAIAHWEAEVARLKAALHPTVAANIDAGMPAHQAFQAAAAVAEEPAAAAAVAEEPAAAPAPAVVVA